MNYLELIFFDLSISARFTLLTMFTLLKIFTSPALSVALQEHHPLLL